MTERVPRGLRTLAATPHFAVATDGARAVFVLRPGGALVEQPDAADFLAWAAARAGRLAFALATLAPDEVRADAGLVVVAYDPGERNYGYYIALRDPARSDWGYLEPAPAAPPAAPASWRPRP